MLLPLTGWSTALALALFATLSVHIRADGMPDEISAAPDSRSDMNEYVFGSLKYISNSFSSAIDLFDVPRVDEADVLSDFWMKAISLGGRVRQYTNKMLTDAASSYHDVAEQLTRFNGTMSQLISSTKSFRLELQDAALTRGISLDDVSDELSRLLADILEELKSEFPSPNQAPSHEERKLLVSDVMTKVEVAIMSLSEKVGMPEEALRLHLSHLRPYVEELVVITGDVLEQHPVLLMTILFAGAILLIPEAWLLRSVLSLFGFGPDGPIKGSAAAWAQRRFWGAAVSRSSWFSLLQSAAMKPGKEIIGGIFAGIGIVLSFFGCCYRGR